MLKFRVKLKETYDDLDYAEKLDCHGLWQQYEALCEKTVKIVLADVIQDIAKDREQVEFARKILPLQNELMKTFYDLVKKEK